FFQAEDGIRDFHVTGVQTCALPIYPLTVPKYDEEIIPSSRIIEARNYYRRYRDLCIIGVGVLYGLNIVDAYVDAGLSNFDISEDLSLKLSPSLQYDPSFAAAGGGVAPGFS